MSPRAAARLEALGFTDVYDFVAGKTDWFACGYPREGTSLETPWVGDLLVDDVATCRVGTRLGDAPDLSSAGGVDYCIVLNDGRVVAGVVRREALARGPESAVEDAMELGPRTIRPSKPVEVLLGKRSSEGADSWIVTDAHGKLLGVLARGDAELALERVSTARAGGTRT